MEESTLLLFSIFILCFVFYFITSLFTRFSGFGKDIKRVLFVVSHPDDEVMFFGPTILYFTKRRDVDVHLLVMSKGDYRGQGVKRKKELYEAAKILGISKERITLLDFTKLQDDPNLRWREELVAEIVLRHVESMDIEAVITFDRHGVSGHKNHSCLYNALALLSVEPRLPPQTKVFLLRSVNVLRKYSGIFDFPMSFLLSSTSFIAGVSEWLRLQRAMAAYESQYVWFRKLYMIFSRYVLINTYDSLNVAIDHSR